MAYNPPVPPSQPFLGNILRRLTVWDLIYLSLFLESFIFISVVVFFFSIHKLLKCLYQRLRWIFHPSARPPFPFRREKNLELFQQKKRVWQTFQRDILIGENPFRSTTFHFFPPWGLNEPARWLLGDLCPFIIFFEDGMKCFKFWKKHSRDQSC